VLSIRRKRLELWVRRKAVSRSPKMKMMTRIIARARRKMRKPECVWPWVFFFASVLEGALTSSSDSKCKSVSNEYK
jgi:hypothetical protein